MKTRSRNRIIPAVGIPNTLQNQKEWHEEVLL